MAYSEKSVERIRKSLSTSDGISEKKMFGGLTFLLNGNMICGVSKSTLVIRVGPDNYEDALGAPHCRPCDFTGRPLKGMVMIDPPGFDVADDLDNWVERGLEYAGSLPPK